MDNVIEIVNAGKKIKNNLILKNVNLKLEKGNIYGLVGQNGSGKSTLLKMIMGLYKCSGEIFINGYNIRKDYRGALKNIGGIVDSAAFYDFLSAKENLKYFALLYGAKDTRISEVMKLTGLNIDEKKQVKYYSLGMKERLGIAISLLKDPDIFVLDEPTNGLDPKGILELRNLLKSFKDKTIIISSHLISEIEKLSTDIIFINNKTTQVKSIDGFRKIRSFRLGKKVKISNELVLSDEEVNVYVRKFVKENIPVYAVNESSGLENMLISMMEAK